VLPRKKKAQILAAAANGKTFILIKLNIFGWLFSPGSVCTPHDSIQEDCTQQLPVNDQQHPTVKNNS
jgi:hypothetical protein